MQSDLFYDANGFKGLYRAFLDNLKVTEWHVYHMVKQLVPQCAFYVHVKHGDNRYELQYTTGVIVKIPKELHDAFKYKSQKLSNI